MNLKFTYLLIFNGLAKLIRRISLSAPIQSQPIPSEFTTFSGIDVAAKDFTAATLSQALTTKPNLAPKPFAQTELGFAQAIEWLAQNAVPSGKHLVVLEATGSYWVALACALHQAGFALAVINPAQAHYFAKAQLKRAKSDKLDAQILAQLAQALSSQLTLWTPPPPLYHELRQRLAQRDSLTDLKTQLSNQLHALCVNPVVIPSVKAQLESLLVTVQAQINAMQQEIKVVLADENEWAKSIALLQTIPGIGLLTASWLVVATLNFTTCPSLEALVSYVGLAPIQRSSGSSIRGRPTIGHSGHARLRTLLYQGSLSAIRANPAIKQFWQRLRQEKNKPVKVARCACARKLLHLAWAIFQSGQPFDKNHCQVEAAS